MQSHDDNERALEIAKATLRTSLNSRCHQAGTAVGAMLLNTAFCGLLLGRGVHAGLLAGWLFLITGLLVVRLWVARQARGALDRSMDDLRRHDTRFRLVSAASQISTGAGIWIVWSAHHEESSYVMTLLICLYGVATTINLAQDYRSVRLTLPMLMGQPILYWLLTGVDGIAISVVLATLLVSMISSARNSYRAFEDSIRIRFEKDELLQQLEREKENALRSLQMAEAANRSKSFFMAAASHDVRQPLYAASILHDTLMLHSMSAEAQKLLTQQGKALATASSLFDNLLDLSKFESGAIEPNITVVQLRELLREIESEFAAVAIAKGLKLVVEPVEHAVHSDYDLLDRMLRNVISNAVKYTQRGKVRVFCEIHNDIVHLHVEDTGIGIAPADQERVFHEFVQVENPQRSREKGVGLGLAIVRHISELLHHKVSVASEVGQGTRITIELSLVTPSSVLDSEEDAAGSPDIDLAGRHVWIVEDDHSVRDALETYFRTRACECETAGSYQDLDRLEQVARTPDVVLVDDMLGSGESGLDRAKQLSERIDPKNILVMTGSGDPKRWEELRASGFAVMRKPIFADALNAWLASFDLRKKSGAEDVSGTGAGSQDGDSTGSWPARE